MSRLLSLLSLLLFTLSAQAEWAETSNSPVTGDNKIRLDTAELNYEASKDKGGWDRFKAASELTAAREAYESRIELRQDRVVCGRVQELGFGNLELNFRSYHL